MSLTLSFDSAKAKIAGVTSLLVLVPALINALNDVYISVRKLPRSETERTNKELFEKYFNKQPVVAVPPLPIKHAMGTVDVRISVYAGGDVLMEYGDRLQWFPFPAVKKEIGGLISAAYAQQASSPRGIGSYKQSETVEGGTLIRERTFDNGVVERQRIDRRTGEIIDRSTRVNAATNQVGPIGVIDLDSHASHPTTGGSTRCVVPNGGCTLVRPLAKGAQCFCATANGTVPGHIQ